MNVSSPRAGFSLIELLLALAIMMVVGTFSTVFYTRSLAQQSIDTTQDQVLGMLRKSQTYAANSRSGGAWGVRYSASTFTLFQGNSYATRTTALDENYSIPSSLSVTGLTEVVFAKSTGLPATTPTITISNTAGTRAINVTAQGVVTRP